MNDTVLRGYCKKCGMGIELDGNLAFHSVAKGVKWPLDGSACKYPDPVWLLSAKQIKIIEESKEFEEYKQRLRAGVGKRPLWLCAILEYEPELIAKILQDNGEYPAKFPHKILENDKNGN